MNPIMCLLLLCAGMTSVPAGNTLLQNDSDTYNAYLQTDDDKAKAAWIKIVNQRTDAWNKNPADTDNAYSLALAQFGLLNATMRTHDEELFDRYIDNAEAVLEKLIDTNHAWGEPQALLSAIYGLKMAYSPYAGMVLGAASNKLMAKALKNAPRSPLVWKLYGNAKFFTPQLWGGDVIEAINAYQKAITLFEAEKSNTSDNWFYLDTLAFLGQAHEKNDDKSSAIAQYEKALQQEPSFGWVAMGLLPKARGK